MGHALPVDSPLGAAILLVLALYALAAALNLLIPSSGAQFAQRDVEGAPHMTACELALFAHVDQGGSPVEARDRFLRRSLRPAAAEQGLEHAQHHDLRVRCRGAGAAAGAQ